MEWVSTMCDDLLKEVDRLGRQVPFAFLLIGTMPYSFGAVVSR
ncbi:hypothetical protein ACFXKJ_41165 [Kitasatospora indigofera]